MSDHGHGHGHHGPIDEALQADILDLDAQLVAEHTASIIDWLPIDHPRRIVDLGAGTGAGTFALLKAFPEARVTAVDASVDHLRRLSAKACERSLEDRIHTVQADLDTEWPDLGTPDLVWASASMHHMADPDRVLRQIGKTLAPQGLLAVVEVSGMPKFFPDDAPHAHDERVPHRGADWGPMLTKAGFTVAGQRTVTVHIERSPAVERYARAVAQADLSRDDLALRSERQVWAARLGHLG